MTRLGPLYRYHSLHARGIAFSGERILDVGCYDGKLLASFKGRLRVGVDLKPEGASSSVCFVQADGRRLPFPTGCFEQVLALDVLEHVPDDANLAGELVRVGRPGGQIFVTTPAIALRMFPPFLTDWISTRWGHHWRRGYSEQGLVGLMGSRCECTVEPWTAPAYRTLYLFLRALAAVWPALAGPLVHQIARYDARHADGHRGFYWMWCSVGATE